MSSRRKFFLVFIFILLDMFLLIGYLTIRDATMLNDLRKETYKLSKLDITKDRYNTKIKTSGRYGTVEKAIKSYLDDYAVLLQDVLNSKNDPKLIKVLSYENYQKDGPEFTESLDYLSSFQKNFNKKMDKLFLDLDESNIRSYIYTKIEDPYYCDLYHKLMLSNSMKGEFQETLTLLEDNRDKMNNLIDVSSEVLRFLKIHKEEWVLEDGEIKFQTDELYRIYIEAIEKIS